MTPREATASSIVEELQRLGAWTTSATPLHDARIRFEVLSDQRELVLEKLGTWGWDVRPCGAGPRIVPAGNSALLQQTSAYELELPREEAPARLATPAGEPIAVPRDTIADDEYRKLLQGFRAGK